VSLTHTHARCSNRKTVAKKTCLLVTWCRDCVSYYSYVRRGMSHIGVTNGNYTQLFFEVVQTVTKALDQINGSNATAFLKSCTALVGR
jgi:hypothetical protein